tara:strand:- start:243 stop:1058 length:816 start_codon:yes stop_codon:yes gene_type:complete
MPELPEVETVCKGLSKKILGKKIKNLKVLNSKLRKKIPKEIEMIFKEKIIKIILRRGKHGLIFFNCDYTLQFHLGMTGKFFISNRKPLIKKHDHVSFEFENNLFMLYNDVRKFGFIDFIKKPIDLINFNELGYEPKVIHLYKKKIIKKIKKSYKSIKDILLDQSFVSGIGNIYASEILFNAKINPKSTGEKISIIKLNNLLKSINLILDKAIEKGGSSISDYNKVDGDLGYFQNNFRVYGRKGLSCFKCKNLIIQLKQSGRSTFYCRNCQK